MGFFVPVYVFVRPVNEGYFYLSYPIWQVGNAANEPFFGLPFSPLKS